MAPPLRANAFGLGPGRAMLDLDRIIGAIEEDPAACVVFERFMGRLWSCGAWLGWARVSFVALRGMPLLLERPLLAI
jgi:hypothetical protein